MTAGPPATGVGLERTQNPRGAGARLRDEIIAGARRVIDGDAGWSLRSVAREVKITAPAIYPHFATLQELEDAVLQESFTQLATAVQEAIRSEGEPVDSLLAGCRAYVAFGWDHRHRYRLMFSRGSFALNALDTFTAAQEAIERCVRSGDSTSVDPRADTYLLWLGLHGIATLEKPTRLEYLGLATPGRSSFLEELVGRMARLHPRPERR